MIRGHLWSAGSPPFEDAISGAEARRPKAPVPSDTNA